MVARIIALLHVIGFVVALASYWAPWVAHQSAGLAVAEVDLVEFPKFMPQVRSGELVVWREAFYLPLFTLAVGLVVWAATTPTPTFPRDEKRVAGEGDNSPSPVRAVGERGRGGVGVRWLMRAFALALPITPSIFNVFEGGEFQSQLKLSGIVLALILLTPLSRHVPQRALGVALAVVFVFGALAPTIQFFQMKPALDAIYRQPIQVGWGVWAGVAGFGLLAITELLGKRVNE